MIHINLLPWREHARQKLLSQIRMQLITAVALPLLLIGVGYLFCLISYNNELENQQQFIDKHKASLSKIEAIKQYNQQAIILRNKTIKLNQLIAERKNLPEVLSITLNQFSNIFIEMLTMDSNKIEMNASSLNQNDALKAFNQLQDQKVFCNVKFSPDTKHRVIKNQRFYFSFSIQICQYVSLDR